METLANWPGAETRTELAWILTGLGGQILFMMRFLVQWVVSEKAKRSVFPVAFWWLSTDGAVVLLAYAIYRAGPVYPGPVDGLPHLRPKPVADPCGTARRGLKGSRSHVFADGGYAGEKPSSALKGHGDRTIEIIKRSDTANGFEVLPRRRVVGRTFAWLGRCRRLAKDCEASIESSTAWALIANIKLMTRRLARYCHVS